ncbi:SUKH-4 family immunity protein [Streptomyces anulatus]|uniref:SUKH-4 family immunity protein n=1 Tax=Streptomyces anulatus TaxID=1892 RepID=UPI003415924D
MNRSDLIRIFGPALAPVLRPDEVPGQVMEDRARFTLQSIGVPTSVGDVVVTDLHDMTPVREFLNGITLPIWAQSQHILKLGLFLDSFLCLNGFDGSVILLTRDLDETPTALSSDLYSFVCILVAVSESVYRGEGPDSLDISALVERIDPGSQSASSTWQELADRLAG